MAVQVPAMMALSAQECIRHAKTEQSDMSYTARNHARLLLTYSFTFCFLSVIAEVYTSCSAATTMSKT